MTDREKYFKYCQMHDSIPEKIQLIKDWCKANGITIYKDIVFISVANEEQDLYFVDYEYSSPRTRYGRIYGNKAQVAFDKMKAYLERKHNENNTV